MQYDRLIKISTAGSRKAVQWPSSALMWSELVARLHTPLRGEETHAQYMALPKPQQDGLKDVGGFVGGTLAGGRRKLQAVEGRDLIALDLDSLPAGSTTDYLRRLESLGCAYVAYSTRKHDEAAPRLRVLLPLDRTVTVEEFEPIARRAAAYIDPSMTVFDRSTFEAHRLMYWPNCSADSQYIYVYGDRAFLSADGVLQQYADWHDVASWPDVPGLQPQIARLAAKQGDPEAKSGTVGAFCKIYNIYKAMEELLPGIYEPCGQPDRYTFTGGSTTGGAVIYDGGKFLYSHHATDPCGGRLVNAFDLVRLHLFADADDEAKPDTPSNKLPSFAAMCQRANEDGAVRALLSQERYDVALEAFGSPGAPQIADDTNWMAQLKANPNTGEFNKTMDNIRIILEHDPLLKGRFGLDEFASRGAVLGALPWDTRTERRIWNDTDDAGAQWYLEKVYRITGRDRVMNALALSSFQGRFNDVQAYLSKLVWDGVPRLDTLLPDYLGSADNAYTRAVMRKSLAAAVARAMLPGTKYDCMPILSGPQGIGKSTFLRLLGGRWFSDSLQTFEGKEACEMVQGYWINEIGELNGLSRSELTSVKQFLSRTEDIFRVPYGRRTDLYPRRCVFFGTTNDAEFLRDASGERRFWPVDVGTLPARKSVFTELAAEVPQIWAEAVVAWQLGEFLDLRGEARDIWKGEVTTHKVHNSKEGIIAEFLDRPIPEDWYKRSIADRRIYWAGGFDRAPAATFKRTKVCAAEIWCECFTTEIKYIKQTDTREINNILEGLGWMKEKTSYRFGGEYGKQRCYTRP